MTTLTFVAKPRTEVICSPLKTKLGIEGTGPRRESKGEIASRDTQTKLHTDKENRMSSETVVSHAGDLGSSY
jgi:hypothetical protein